MDGNRHVLLTHTMKRLSILIVNFNTCGLLLDCLRSIREYGPQIPHEVIVIDNASTDESVPKLQADFRETILIVNARNVGFAAANNQGLKCATGDYVLLLNSDTKLTDGAVDTLVGFLEKNPEAAAAAPMLLNNDGSWQRSFFRFPSALRTFFHILGISRLVLSYLKSRRFAPFLSRTPGLGLYAADFDLEKPRKVAYVLFACILLRREVLAKVGMLDERLFFYHEDCEFGYRLANAGLAIWWVPSSKVFHLGGGTSRSALRESFRYYYESLLHVFQKHESPATNLALRMAIFFGFMVRAGLTLFGPYKSLQIPSTYGSKPSGCQRAFGWSIDRCSYYSSLAALAWRR